MEKTLQTIPTEKDFNLSKVKLLPKGGLCAEYQVTVIVDGENWAYDKDNNTYYYKHPVEVGEETPNLLASAWSMDPVSEDLGGLTYYYYPVMEVLAEAIQADGKIGDKPAVTDAWGVIVSKDSEGNEYLSGFAAG